MIAVATDLPVSKSTRRPSRKATAPKVDSKVKVGLYISAESARRLGITSTMESKDRSQIVDDLIREHLRKYVVHVRGDRPSEASVDTGEDRQTQAV